MELAQAEPVRLAEREALAKPFEREAQVQTLEREVLAHQVALKHYLQAPTLLVEQVARARQMALEHYLPHRF